MCLLFVYPSEETGVGEKQEAGESEWGQEEVTQSLAALARTWAFI